MVRANRVHVPTELEKLELKKHSRCLPPRLRSGVVNSRSRAPCGISCGPTSLHTFTEHLESSYEPAPQRRAATSCHWRKRA
jgi:hypothetical protein